MPWCSEHVIACHAWCCRRRSCLPGLLVHVHAGCIALEARICCITAVRIEIGITLERFITLERSIAPGVNKHWGSHLSIQVELCCPGPPSCDARFQLLICQCVLAGEYMCAVPMTRPCSCLRNCLSLPLALACCRLRRHAWSPCARAWHPRHQPPSRPLLTASCRRCIK